MAGRGVFNRNEGLVNIKTPNNGVANYQPEEVKNILEKSSKILAILE